MQTDRKDARIESPKLAKSFAVSNAQNLYWSPSCTDHSSIE